MNTQIKHTPGPWYAANMGNDYQGLVIDEKTGANIAVTYDKRHAPFVAAAPAMYEALRLAEHNLTEIENYIGGDAVPAGLLDTVRAVIAQAEGRAL